MLLLVNDYAKNVSVTRVVHPYAATINFESHPGLVEST